MTKDTSTSWPILALSAIDPNTALRQLMDHVDGVAHRAPLFVIYSALQLYDELLERAARGSVQYSVVMTKELMLQICTSGAEKRDFQGTVDIAGIPLSEFADA